MHLRRFLLDLLLQSFVEELQLLLILTQGFFCMTLLGHIAPDFEKAVSLPGAQRTHLAVDKDTRATLTQVPTDVRCNSLRLCRLQFFLRLACRAVFWRKQHIGFLPENFCLTPPENLLRARVPRIDYAVGPGRENRVALRAVED